MTTGAKKTPTTIRKGLPMLADATPILAELQALNTRLTENLGTVATAINSLSANILSLHGQLIVSNAPWWRRWFRKL